MEIRTLGRSDMRVSAVGLGAWSWGSTRYWEYGTSYRKEDIAQAIEKAVEMGIDLLDTAEVYGRGASERLIGELVPKDDFYIASKYAPLHLLPSSILAHAERSRKRLQVEAIDLYQVHFHNPLLSLRATMRNLEKLVREGKIRHIGVSNFNVQTLEKARSYLSRCDIVSNQVHFNLANRAPERNGMLDYCRKERISIIAWSPLQQGALTGKYPPGKRPGGWRARTRYFRNSHLKAVQPVLQVLDECSKAHGRTTAQGALAWLLRHPEVVIIPGANRAEQVEMNAGAVGWSFTQAELDRLDQASAKLER